jgi:hypothetical protein
VRVTELGVIHRPPASVGIAQNHAPQVLAPGLGASRAVAERNDRQAPGNLVLRGNHLSLSLYIRSHRCVADRLDAVSIRVDNERSVVVAMVYRARPRSAVVTTARGNCGGMECPHRLAIMRSKTDVHTARRLDAAGLERNRELHA